MPSESGGGAFWPPLEYGGASRDERGRVGCESPFVGAGGRGALGRTWDGPARGPGTGRPAAGERVLISTSERGREGEGDREPRPGNRFNFQPGIPTRTGGLLARLAGWDPGSSSRRPSAPPSTRHAARARTDRPGSAGSKLSRASPDALSQSSVNRIAQLVRRASPFSSQHEAFSIWSVAPSPAIQTRSQPDRRIVA